MLGSGNWNMNHDSDVRVLALGGGGRDGLDRISKPTSESLETEERTIDGR